MDEGHRALPFTLIGHSMGGVVARLAVEHCSLGADDVDSVITVATPHLGSIDAIGMLFGLARSVAPTVWLPDLPLSDSITEIGCGNYHVCVRHEGGEVQCWGRGDKGATDAGNTEHIGDNEGLEGLAMVEIGVDTIELAVSEYHTCVLLSSTEIRCWGNSDNGQLGYGSVEQIGDDETPAEVEVSSACSGSGEWMGVARASSRPRGATSPARRA